MTNLTLTSEKKNQMCIFFSINCTKKIKLKD